jgi:hypothetical protein
VAQRLFRSRRDMRGDRWTVPVVHSQRRCARDGGTAGEASHWDGGPPTDFARPDGPYNRYHLFHHGHRRTDISEHHLRPTKDF